tara:strand:- start:1273 stop:2406 length:1134 start_codon:yes stop_codon:yes gene_type:complete
MIQPMQYPYKAPFESILPAQFLYRPNRFIVHCQLASGGEVRAFLPNPGRLQELLLPDVTVYVVPEPPESVRKTRYTMVGVAGEDGPIFLHTHVNNDVARHLLTHDLIPGLEGAEIVRAEVPHGHSRFDFLLERDGESIYVEVKSCTLFGNGVAMFPDAVTERGRRHLEELAALADGGTQTVVIFVVHSGAVACFMPDYHTDLAFSKTLLAVRERVRILPVAVQWTEHFTIEAQPVLLPIPWDYIAHEASDRGNWLIVLHLPEGNALAAGYYVAGGWCAEDLGATLRSLVRPGRRKPSPLQPLLMEADAITSYPIVSSVEKAEDIVAALDEGLGLSTPAAPILATEESIWLRHSRENPTTRRVFHTILAQFRMTRPTV